MELTVTGVDYAPSELHEQVPFVVELIREMPGDDRPDYWLGLVHPPLRWIEQDDERPVTHVIVAARGAGTAIESGIDRLPIGIAFVKDPTLLSDARLDFSKCAYVAIGIASDTSKAKRLGAAELGMAFILRINARDLEGLSDLMTEDHRLVDKLGGEVAGKEACRQAWASFFAQFGDYQNHVERAVSRADSVAMRGHSTCSDPRLSGPALWSARVLGNRLREWRVHEDTGPNRERLGL